MKIYMIRNYNGGYCVFSETAMNSTSSLTETKALANFYEGHTFDTTCSINSTYVLNNDCTALHRDNNNGPLFGTVMYEILPSTDISTYEYW